MRRQITPADFANLIRRAQGERMNGASKIAAARYACVEAGISSDWSIPLLAFLNDSPTVAEVWADRVINETLDRAFGLATPESFHG